MRNRRRLARGRLTAGVRVADARSFTHMQVGGGRAREPVMRLVRQHSHSEV